MIACKSICFKYHESRLGIIKATFPPIETSLFKHIEKRALSYDQFKDLRNTELEYERKQYTIYLEILILILVITKSRLLMDRPSPAERFLDYQLVYHIN